MSIEQISPQTLARAAAIVRRGGLVVTPSLTNYGLLCDPFNPAAVERVFEAKRRTKFGPLMLFVRSADEARRYARVPRRLSPTLLDEIWPRPVALILERTYPFPERMTFGLPTLALCCQGDSPLQRIAELLGGPVAGTSANLSGQGDIDVDFEKAAADLADKVDLVLDEGAQSRAARKPQAFPGNSIVDLSFDPPHLVRRGALSADDLRPFLPDLDADTTRYGALLAGRVAAERGAG